MSVPSPDFEDLEFDVISEDWNEYELTGHTKARGKIVVTRFVRSKNHPDPNAINMASQNMFVITAPPEQRGVPSPLNPQEIKTPDGTPIDILSSNEKWNKYRLKKSGGIVKVKMVVHDAFRIPGRFDNDGMPAYIFTSGPLVVPEKTKPEFSV